MNKFVSRIAFALAATLVVTGVQQPAWWLVAGVVARANPLPASPGRPASIVASPVSFAAGWGAARAVSCRCRPDW